MLTQQTAKELGAKMLEQMRDPKQWKIRVHKNLHWFVQLEHKPCKGLLTVAPEYHGAPEYKATLSLNFPYAGDSRWEDFQRFDKPQDAVDYMIDRARHTLKSEWQTLKLIAGEPGGAMTIQPKRKG
jgi:hypothetical protein